MLVREVDHGASLNAQHAKVNAVHPTAALMDGQIMQGWLWQYREDLLTLSRQALALEALAEWKAGHRKRQVGVPFKFHGKWKVVANDGETNLLAIGESPGLALVALAIKLGVV